MSARRTGARLLRAYPPAWRRRYGAELENLIAEASAGGRVGWRTGLDVLLGGGRERLRAAAGGSAGSPGERQRGALIQVLWAWALFVVGGLVLQRFAEHWQAATPGDARSLPDVAFAVLTVAAACGAVLVLVGLAAAVPALVVSLREAGAWSRLRRQLAVPALLTALAAAAAIALVAWAAGLDAHQREGGDAAYAAAFLLTALLGCACLAAWTAAAAGIARRLDPGAAVLRLQSWLGAGLALTMATIVAALAVWWVSLATAGSSFLAGQPAGGVGSTVPAQLLLAALLMVGATLLAASAARRALCEPPSSL